MPSKHFCISNCISGGLITNYRCTSSCAHCLYRCGPKWPHDYITAETARSNFAKLKELGCHAVHIGGGEPFLKPRELIQVLTIARDTGVAIEYVETNSSWFRDAVSAREILDELLGTGLTSLLVSISPFHNAYIPFGKVKGLLAACKASGMNVYPWRSEFYAEIDSFDDSLPHELGEYEEKFGEGYLESLTDRYGIDAGGRALKTFSKLGRQKTIPALKSESRAGCTELSQVKHFHLDLYGNYIPGLCAGLSIAREDLGKPLDPVRYPILTRLHSKGIGGLLSHAMDEFGFEASRPVYSSKCELCYEIRHFLVVAAHQNSCELQPQNHYLN